jgi:lysophospholipase L1-like esterase
MAFPTWLFIGDSLVEYCNWQEKFPHVKLYNFGIAGETVEGLLGRIDLVMDRFKTLDLILIMSGINNVAMEDFGFLISYEKVIEKVRGRFPDARLVVNCLLPVRLPWFAEDTVPRVNERLQLLAAKKKVEFLDIYQKFTDSDNRFDATCFLEDGVHVSDHGYKVWHKAIEVYLDEE